jgi:ArsR family transcriptional regulator
MEYTSTRTHQQSAELARLFSVLANPLRLSILSLLMERCAANDNVGCRVQEINARIDVPQPYLSKHLKVLAECGILTHRREKNKVFYCFAHQSTLCRVFDFFSGCCDTFSRIKKDIQP